MSWLESVVISHHAHSIIYLQTLPSKFSLTMHAAAAMGQATKTSRMIQTIE